MSNISMMEEEEELQVFPSQVLLPCQQPPPHLPGGAISIDQTPSPFVGVSEQRAESDQGMRDDEVAMLSCLLPRLLHASCVSNDHPLVALGGMTIQQRADHHDEGPPAARGGGPMVVDRLSILAALLRRTTHAHAPRQAVLTVMSTMVQLCRMCPTNQREEFIHRLSSLGALSDLVVIMERWSFDLHVQAFEMEAVTWFWLDALELSSSPTFRTGRLARLVLQNLGGGIDGPSVVPTVVSSLAVLICLVGPHDNDDSEEAERSYSSLDQIFLGLPTEVAGLAAIVVQAMKRFPHDATIQHNGLSALVKLLTGPWATQNLDMLPAIDSSNVIVSAARNYYPAAHIVLSACVLLHTLLLHQPSTPTTVTFAKALTRAGGVLLLVSVLNSQNKLAIDISLYAWPALSNILSAQHDDDKPQKQFLSLLSLPPSSVSHIFMAPSAGVASTHPLERMSLSTQTTLLVLTRRALEGLHTHHSALTVQIACLRILHHLLPLVLPSLATDSTGPFLTVILRALQSFPYDMSGVSAALTALTTLLTHCQGGSSSSGRQRKGTKKAVRALGTDAEVVASLQSVVLQALNKFPGEASFQDSVCQALASLAEYGGDSLIHAGACEKIGQVLLRFSDAPPSGGGSTVLTSAALAMRALLTLDADAVISRLRSLGMAHVFPVALRNYHPSSPDSAAGPPPPPPSPQTPPHRTFNSSIGFASSSSAMDSPRDDAPCSPPHTPTPTSKRRPVLVLQSNRLHHKTHPYSYDSPTTTATAPCSSITAKAAVTTSTTTTSSSSSSSSATSIALDVLLEDLLSHPSDPTRQREGLSRLASTCTRDAKRRSALMRGGACRAVVAAMQAFAHDTSLLLAGLHALHALCMDDTGNVVALVEQEKVGLREIITAGLQQHQQNHEGQSPVVPGDGTMKESQQGWGGDHDAVLRATVALVRQLAQGGEQAVRRRLLEMGVRKALKAVVRALQGTEHQQQHRHHHHQGEGDDDSMMDESAGGKKGDGDGLRRQVLEVLAFLPDDEGRREKENGGGGDWSGLTSLSEAAQYAEAFPDIVHFHANRATTMTSSGKQGSTADGTGKQQL